MLCRSERSFILDKKSIMRSYMYAYAYSTSVGCKIFFDSPTIKKIFQNLIFLFFFLKKSVGKNSGKIPEQNFFWFVDELVMIWWKMSTVIIDSVLTHLSKKQKFSHSLIMRVLYALDFLKLIQYNLNCQQKVRTWLRHYWTW